MTGFDFLLVTCGVLAAIIACVACYSEGYAAGLAHARRILVESAEYPHDAA